MLLLPVTPNPTAIHRRLFFPTESALQPAGLLHTRGIAGSGLRPLSNIPHCCLPWESGPCLSPSVADHPLRPATDRCLGRPLPYQLANRTRALPIARACKQRPSFSLGMYAVLARVPRVVPHYRVDSHALLTRPPLYLPPKGLSRSTCMC